MIPQSLHVIWVGDEAKRPDKWIESWRDMHPSWAFKLWGNEELENYPWRMKKQMAHLAKKQKWPAVSDLMRYEYLLQFGGVHADADSECIRPLDDLLGNEAFAAMENETFSPGLIGNSCIGAKAGHPVMKALVNAISRRRDPLRTGPWKWKWPRFRRKEKQAWEAIGPKALTAAINKLGGFTILPSVSFYPVYHNGARSPVEGVTYCRQHWGSTTGIYRRGSYDDPPSVPVNIYMQADALREAIGAAIDCGKEPAHIDALRAALATVRAQTAHL